MTQPLLTPKNLKKGCEMKLIVPKYYKDFSCKGGICSDNCCIGWEIDIDEKALEKYRAEGGKFGEELRQTIADEGGISHFVLCGERCPHLNSENLCKLMIEKGHGYLCEICREHPRFYTLLDDRAFGGVGLSCEAAAELILTDNSGEYIILETEGDGCECDGEVLRVTLSLRDKILKILSDGTQSIVYIIKESVRLAEEAERKLYGSGEDPCVSREFPDIYTLFEDMEFMSDELPELLQRPAERPIDDNANSYLHNILAYFIHRYLPKAAVDGYILGKVAFASVSAMAIAHLFSLEAELTLDRAIYLQSSTQRKWNTAKKTPSFSSKEPKK